MNKNGQTKLASSIITLLVVGMLFFASPASAVDLYLTTPGHAYEGEVAEFDLKLDLNTGERIPIDSITFTISGPISKTCVFDVQGNAISGCDDLVITQTANAADYGYGYGYGYGIGGATNFGYGYGYGETGMTGELRWNIKWNTTGQPLGDYTIDYEVNSPGRAWQTPAPSTFRIKVPETNVTVIKGDVENIAGIDSVRFFFQNGTEINGTIPEGTQVTLVMTTTVNGDPATITLPNVNIDDFVGGSANIITNLSNAITSTVNVNANLNSQFIVQFQNFTNILPLPGFQGVEMTFSVPTGTPLNKVVWISDDVGATVTVLPQLTSAPSFPITTSNMGYRRNGGNLTIWIPHLSGAAGGLDTTPNPAGRSRSGGGFNYSRPVPPTPQPEPTPTPTPAPTPAEQATITLDESDVTNTIESDAAPTPAPQAQQRGRFARLTGFVTGDGEGVPAWTKALLLGFVVFVIATAGVTGFRKLRK